MSGLNYLHQSKWLKTCNGMRDYKSIVFHLSTVMTTSDEKVHKFINFRKVDDYVNDIDTESHYFKC